MGLLSFIGGLLGLGGTPSTRAIQVSKASAASGLPIIYGRRKVTPIKVFKTVSRNNAPLDVPGETYDHSFITQSPSEYEETRKSFDWLHRIDVWGQGKITAIEKFWLDGDEATISRFKNRPYFRALSNYGSDSQTAMTALTAASGRWTVSHRGLGVAYTWSRFYNSSKKPQFNAEPNLKAQVKGLGVYDPRKDSSQPGGAGNQTFADPSSWGYSENRALLVLNYLTSDYGFAAPLADVDVPSFMKAADQCDEPATIPARSTNTTGGIIPNYWDRRNGEFIDILPDEPFVNHRENQVGTSQPRWHASAELDPKLGVIKNLKLLLEGFGWALTWSNGKHRLVLEDTVAAPVATFGEDSIMGGWTSDHGMRDGRWNRITVEFPNENKDFEQDTVSWPEKGSTQHNTYLAEDGGEELHKVEQVSTITDYYRAQAYAEYLVRKSRVGHRIKGMRLAPEAMLLEPGDVIAIDYAAKGFVNDWFFVERVSVSRTLEVSVDLLKYDATVYDPDARTDEPVDLGKDSPDLWLDPPAITGLAIVEVHETKADGSVISGLDVNWDAPDATVGLDRIELAWRLHEGATAQDHTADGPYTGQTYLARDVTSYRIMGLADDKNYDVRVVYWTQRGQQSDEAVQNIDLLAANSKLDGIDDGATRNTHRGEYLSYETYDPGDIVTYAEASYLMTAEASISGIVPTNTTYWARLSAMNAGVEVVRSPAEPAVADLPEGSFWFDTSDVKLYVLEAGEWVEAATSNTVLYQTGTPASGKVGDLWYDTNDNILYGFDGVSWSPVGNFLTNTSELVDDAGLGSTAVWDSVTGRARISFAVNENANGSYDNRIIRFFGLDGIHPDRTKFAQFIKPDGSAFQWGKNEHRGSAYSGNNSNGVYYIVLDTTNAANFAHGGTQARCVAICRNLSASTLEYYKALTGFVTKSVNENMFVIGFCERRGNKYVNGTLFDPVPVADAPDIFSLVGIDSPDLLPIESVGGVYTLEPSAPLSAADVGASVTVSVAATTLYFGDSSLSYGTGSVTELLFNTRYWIYAVDNSFSGGNVTYKAATSRTGLPARAVYFGSIVTPSNGTQGTTGTQGGYAGGGGTYDPNYNLL